MVADRECLSWIFRVQPSGYLSGVLMREELSYAVVFRSQSWWEMGTNFHEYRPRKGGSRVGVSCRGAHWDVPMLSTSMIHRAAPGVHEKFGLSWAIRPSGRQYLLRAGRTWSISSVG